MDYFDLSERVAVVTGGSRGIGLAVAQGLAAAGAACIIADIEAGRGEEAAAAIRAEGGQAGSVYVDVTRRDSVQEMVDGVVGEHGRIDVLVNSAGIIVRNPIEEATDEDWDNIINVNLRGVFLCSQIVGREMIKRKRGKIINISSNIVQPLQVGRGVYAVSKAGVSQLTRVMALEWAPHSINVNAIAPAPSMTELNKRYFEEHPEDLALRVQSLPLGRLGDPRDYVGMAVLLAGPGSDFITGQTIFVDGGSNLI